MRKGSIIAFAGDADDLQKMLRHGWAVCDGSVVNGFQTPDLRGRFLEGVATLAEAGETHEAGLPNATGSIDTWHPHTPYNGYPTGCVFIITKYGSANFHYSVTNNQNEFYAKTAIDLSLSNPLYGASETVQPPAVTAVFLVKVR